MKYYMKYARQSRVSDHKSVTGSEIALLEQIVSALPQTAASNVEQRIVTLSVITIIFINKEFIIIMSACCKDILVYTWSAKLTKYTLECLKSPHILNEHNRINDIPLLNLNFSYLFRIMGGCILDKLLAFTWTICYFECHGTWHAVAMHAVKSNLRCQKGHVEICVA